MGLSMTCTRDGLGSKPSSFTTHGGPVGVEPVATNPTLYHWFEYRRPLAGPTPYRNAESFSPGGLTKWSSAASVASPLQRRVRQR